MGLMRVESIRRPALSEVEWVRGGNITVIIPNPHEGQIGVGFLTRILRQAGVTCEEWLGKS